jgi:hypothetical protein
LEFQDLALGLGDTSENWVQLDNASKQTSTSLLPMGQIALTESQKGEFKVSQEIDKAFLSFDRRYAVYAGEADTEWSTKYWGHPLAIADLLTKEFVLLELPISENFSIRWNTENTAFTVETTTEYAAELIYYVGNIDPSFSLLLTKDITYDQDVNGELWTIYDAYAISPDGGKLLVANGSTLILLDIADPKSNKIIASDVVRRAATFILQTEQVAYLNQDGLMLVNLADMTATKVSFDPKALGLQPVFAQISPAMNAIAIIEFTEDGMRELYIVDLDSSPNP